MHLDTKIAFSVDEAALRAGICRDYIYRAIREGKLEARKLGRRTIITDEALRSYLKSLPPIKLPRDAA
jgi:excisionase family DNA binding protein